VSHLAIRHANRTVQALCVQPDDSITRHICNLPDKKVLSGFQWFLYGSAVSKAAFEALLGSQWLSNAGVEGRPGLLSETAIHIRIISVYLLKMKWLYVQTPVISRDEIGPFLLRLVVDVFAC
jgi:hypothetical protein